MRFFKKKPRVDLVEEMRAMIGERRTLTKIADSDIMVVEAVHCCVARPNQKSSLCDFWFKTNDAGVYFWVETSAENGHARCSFNLEKWLSMPIAGGEHE